MFVGGVPFPSNMKYLSNTPVLVACISVLLLAMLLVDQSKVMVRNEHLDFEIGHPPVDITQA